MLTLCLHAADDEASVAQKQNAICCLALHAERDENVRILICEDTAALNQLLTMLQVSGWETDAA